MLKRFSDAIRKQSGAVDELLGKITSAQRSSFIVASTQDAKSEAFKSLRSQIKDMSSANLKSSLMIPTEQLAEWNKQLPSELDANQLEELAGSLFKGDVKEVGHDLEKAVRLWEHADKLGSLEAKYCLASCVRDGVVYKKDLHEAFRMFEEVANAGEFPAAHFIVGTMCNRGEGTEKNPAKAFASFKTAAEQGVVRAFYDLAVFYANGKVVPKNEELAVQYFDTAAEAGDINAKFALSGHLLKGAGVAQNKERSLVLLSEAADFGHPGAQFNMGIHYIKGDGVVKDVAKAASYFEKARLQGVLQAGINLVSLYRGNHGHSKDLAKAAELLRIYVGQSSESNEHLKAILKEVEAEMSKK